MHIKCCRNYVKFHFGELYFETNLGELFRSWDKSWKTLGHHLQAGVCMRKCACMQTCVHVRGWECARTWLGVCSYIHMWVCVHVHICASVSVWACTSRCVCVSLIAECGRELVKINFLKEKLIKMLLYARTL